MCFIPTHVLLFTSNCTKMRLVVRFCPNPPWELTAHPRLQLLRADKGGGDGREGSGTGGKGRRGRRLNPTARLLYTLVMHTLSASSEISHAKKRGVKTVGEFLKKIHNCKSILYFIQSPTPISPSWMDCTKFGAWIRLAHVVIRHILATFSGD